MGFLEIATILSILFAVAVNAVWMHQIYPNGNGTTSGDNGLVGILQRFVAGDLRFHLFTAPTSPIDQTLTLAGLTELAASGYGNTAVAAAAFTLGGVVSNNGSLMAAPIGFGTNTGGSTISNIYGYYVTDDLNTVLLAAANFDSAPLSVLNGAAFPLVVPVFGDFSQYLS